MAEPGAGKKLGADGASKGSSGPKPGLAVRPFGKYFLVRKLAEGGMAEIFLAKQVGAEGFERNVVIKRMLPHLSAVPDFVGMFLDEARLAARLGHQNIIQINDLGLADGCYYICMEYLAGEDFSTVLRTASRRREYVPLHLVLRVIADAALGLNFAHEFTDDQGQPLNIVHRDISPSNVYVTYQGQVKLLDFGIAKAESRVTNTTAGVVKGKYMYMSPEQARSGAVDRRSDVFSLGVSLYEALTNVRPFARDNDLAILNAVLQCDFNPPRKVRSDLPPEVEQVVLKAMRARPEDRYQSAAAMATDLERYLAATTSGGGQSTLATYLRSFFGEERYASKTRVPSLVNLAASGVDVPGFSNPHSPKTDPEGPGTTDATKAVGVPKSVETGLTTARRQRVRGMVLTSGGTVALVGGLALAGYFLLREPAASIPTPPPPSAPLGTSPGVTPPPAPAPIPAPTPAPTPAPAPTPPPDVSKARPVTLTPDMVQGVVARHQAAMMKCFDVHKDQLGADRGVVHVTFAIANTGKVTGAQCELSGQVGRCLEGKVRQMRFPTHKDREVRLTLPFQWEVRR